MLTAPTALLLQELVGVFPQSEMPPAASQTAFAGILAQNILARSIGAQTQPMAGAVDALAAPATGLPTSTQPRTQTTDAASPGVVSTPSWTALPINLDQPAATPWSIREATMEENGPAAEARLAPSTLPVSGAPPEFQRAAAPDVRMESPIRAPAGAQSALAASPLPETISAPEALEPGADRPEDARRAWTETEPSTDAGPIVRPEVFPVLVFGGPPVSVSEPAPPILDDPAPGIVIKNGLRALSPDRLESTLGPDETDDPAPVEIQPAFPPPLLQLQVATLSQIQAISPAIETNTPPAAPRESSPGAVDRERTAPSPIVPLSDTPRPQQPREPLASASIALPRFMPPAFAPSEEIPPAPPDRLLSARGTETEHVVAGVPTPVHQGQPQGQPQGEQRFAPPSVQEVPVAPIDALTLLPATALPLSPPITPGITPGDDIQPPAPIRAPMPAAPVIAQVAPAIVTLFRFGEGAHRVTLRLEPETLGRVDISIERTAEAPARIVVTAERPETLALLQHDRPRLEQALDRAGLTIDAASVQFHTAPLDQPPTASTPGASNPFGGGDGGSARQGFAGGHSSPQSQSHAARASEEEPTRQPSTRPVRSGIDIMA